MTVDEYLSGPEDLRRRELVWGVVREPPAPFVPHQQITLRMAVLLDTHVRGHDLGIVLVSPLDVVLDARQALVVQPDVLFVSHARSRIVRECIWGAADLVVEVASRRTTRYDGRTKVGWYRTYGVRECWLVEPESRVVIVVDLLGADDAAARRFEGDEPVRSSVLPAFDQPAAAFFA